MSRNLEARLCKLEEAFAGRRMTHEDWLARLSPEPMTEAEIAALDARIEAQAIAEHGSLPAAAAAYRAKARQTRDPFDAFMAADLECRTVTKTPHALA